MRILVDLNRCQAYAQCCFLAPDVFELRGREVLFASPEVDPGQAILVDDGSGDSDHGAAR